MRKKLTKIFFFFVFTLVLLHSEDLTSQYKQMMSATPVHTNNETTSEKPIEVNQTSNNTNHNLIGEIKKIQVLKQDTFESSKDFIARRDSAIVELSNQVKFSAQNGLKDYSTGTVKMKSYDADRERMQLSLTWNNDLKTIFPEIDKLKTVSLNIARDEAKQLFENKDTHYFHIYIKFLYNKLTISKMLIYDKFELYKPVIKKPAKKVEAHTQKTSAFTPYKNSSPSCQKYIVNISQLNIRSYPNKGNNIIGAVYRGNTVCVYESSNRWKRINKGWISGKHLVLKNNYTTRNIGIVYGLDSRGDGFLSIRRKPKSTEIGRLYNGSRVEILGKRGKWYKVRDLNTGTVGWSHGKWISVR